VLVKVNPQDGSLLLTGPTITEELGGITSDGTNLWAVHKWGPELFKINPADGSVIDTFYITGAPGIPLPMGGGGLAYSPDLDTLYVAKGSQVFRIDPAKYSVFGRDWLDPLGELGYYMPPDVQGLALINNVFYMAPSPPYPIIRSWNPQAGVPYVEETTAGDYTASLIAQWQWEEKTGEKESPLAEFKLKKVTEVTIKITKPKPDFAAAEPIITIEGEVNDPSISEVLVGVALPETTLLKNTFEKGLKDEATGEEWTMETQPGAGPGWTYYTGPSLWHRTERRAYESDWSMWYGKEETGNYETFGYPWPSAWWEESIANAGALVSPEFTIGKDTKLRFWTWWQTDPGVWSDKKLVQLWLDNDWKTIGQIVDYEPMPWDPLPEPLAPGFKWLVVPMTPGCQSICHQCPSGVGRRWK